MKYDRTNNVAAFLILLVIQSTQTLGHDEIETSTPYWDSSYTSSQNRSLRIVSICFSSLSLLAGAYGIFWFFFHQYKKRHRLLKAGYRTRAIQFRQKLVLALILFDFLKALVLTIYPAAKLNGVHDSPLFASVIGWFTNVAIEGGDMCAFLLAVQTAMLVFAPRNGNSTDNLWNRKISKYFQNGLYPYRKFIYVACFAVFPTLLSSLAFIGSDYPAAALGYRGYVPLPTFVFLPAVPAWYRAALSWGPRYFIMFAIIAIYFAVFVHVKREFMRLDVSMAALAGAEGRDSLEQDKGHKATWKRVLIWLSQFPGLGALHSHHGQDAEDEIYEDGGQEHWSDEETSRQGSFLETPADPLTVLSSMTPTSPMNEEPLPVTHSRRAANLSDLQSHLNKQNLKRFRKRRADIERQMNYIFIYPLAYILLWTGPFVQQAMQYASHRNEFSPFPVMIWAVVSQASNCLIDTVVFILRESNYRKWRRERKLQRLAEQGDECAECNEKPNNDQQSRSEENESSAGTITSPHTFNNYEIRFGTVSGGASDTRKSFDYPDSDPLSGFSSRCETPPMVTVPPIVKIADSDTVPPIMFVRSTGGVTFSNAYGNRRSGEYVSELPIHQTRHSSHSSGPRGEHHRGSICWGFGGRRRSEISNGDEEVDLIEFLRQ